MRVTDRILQNTFLANLASSSERLYDAETRVLTGKRINKPSDDPVDVLTSLNIRTKLSEIEQYQRNITMSKKTLETTESAVDELVDVFQRLLSLTVQGASDSYSAADKQSIAGEVNQLLEQIVSIANNRSESLYTFGGTNNNRSPYEVVRDSSGDIIEVRSNGTAGDITGVIGERLTIKINMNGETLFEQGENLFLTIINIRDHLRSNDTDSLRDDINHINQASEQIYTAQASIGARLNRISAAESRAENDSISFTEFLSDTEDIDASQAIMDYQMELLTLQATLQAGARLMHPKLLDFLQ
ncbi:flagellar hook-associated protein FlgL [Candidatus Latescibacterota bacterium]